MAAFTLGVLVGGVVAALGVTVMRRRREATTSAVLDQVDPPTGGADGNRDLLDRIGRVVDDLVNARTDADVARQRLEEALERLAEGIVVCDSAGQIVFTNRSGAGLSDPRHEDALVAAAVSQALGSALSGTADSRSVDLFGPPARIISVDAQPLGDDQAPTGAVATIIDESRLRRLEAVRSDFVANVSHELKTPIGGLALLAEALSEAGDGEEQQRLAERVLHEAHRVSRVVDDLLALGEIEGDLAPRRERVAVGELLARTRADVAVLAEASAIEVDMAPAGEDLAVVGDVVQLTSALSNLVENAVKYSGGASPVVVRAHPEDRFVRFTVRDRGIGIPRRDLDRVFERFYRVDQARSRITGGTGLGLAIVRNVVQGHGGRVELTSREGEGTTVTVRVPRAVGCAQPDEASGRAPSPQALS